MEFKEYKENVKRTNPNLGSLILNSMHMCLGMCSEIYELHEGCTKQDKVNIGEELTDIAWYASNYCNIRNITPEEGIVSLPYAVLSTDIKEYELTIAWTMLVNSISELQDYDKKEFAYNKPETKEISDNRKRAISDVFLSLTNLYFVEGLYANNCMQNNIDKLRARFPDKFDEDKANNRDLSAERRELEK